MHKTKPEFNHSQKKIASESTRLEITAMEAERVYIKRKQLRFLATKYNQKFKGTISGMNPKGFYVQLNDILADGFVKIETVDDDFYYFDESMMKFRGRKYKSEISFGQTIEIMVEQVNIQKGFADFILVN